MEKKKYICPICGYDKLNKPPYDEIGEPTFKTCPCCGFEYGYDDYINKETFESYREKWLANNFDFADKNKMPDNWNVIKQLNNLSGFLFKKGIKGGTYMEFQYCEKKLPLNEIFKLDNIVLWKDDSIFVESFTNVEEKLFFPYYDDFFCAMLYNGAEGFDSWDVNYYPPEKAKEIYEKIKVDENLPDRQILLNWLKMAVKKNNGFYILGVEKQKIIF